MQHKNQLMVKVGRKQRPATITHIRLSCGYEMSVPPTLDVTEATSVNGCEIISKRIWFSPLLDIGPMALYLTPDNKEHIRKMDGTFDFIEQEKIKWT